MGLVGGLVLPVGPVILGIPLLSPGPPGKPIGTPVFGSSGRPVVGSVCTGRPVAGFTYPPVLGSMPRGCPLPIVGIGCPVVGFIVGAVCSKPPVGLLSGLPVELLIGYP